MNEETLVKLIALAQEYRSKKLFLSDFVLRMEWELDQIREEKPV